MSVRVAISWTNKCHRPSVTFQSVFQYPVTILSQEQRYNLHEHVLRCVPLITQDTNPAKEFFTVKLKLIVSGCVFH